MTRVELDGQDAPIPVHALPAFGTSDDLSPTLLTFTDDTEFPVHVYRDLGFTHFEATAVGAAGGLGGCAAPSGPYSYSLPYKTAVVSTLQQVPGDIWSLIREKADLGDFMAQFGWANYAEPQTFYDWTAWGKNYLGQDQLRPYTRGDGSKSSIQPRPIPIADGSVVAWSNSPQRGRRYTGLNTGWFYPSIPSSYPFNTFQAPPDGYKFWLQASDGTYYRAVDILRELGLTTYDWRNAAYNRFTPSYEPHYADVRSSSEPDPAWDFTYLEAFDFVYNTQAKRVLSYREMKDVALIETIQQGSIGGGGGGGGMHRVSGALADLPDSVLIGVGKAGADGAWGQVHKNGVDTPTMSELDPSMSTSPTPTPHPGAADGTRDAAENRVNEINNYLRTITNTYTRNPPASFGNPSTGADGGGSYFHDICKASGGKGGSPGMVWDPVTSKFVTQGWGGDGGVGGQLEAGGGGLGSKVYGQNGHDGLWTPPTGIGAGGGGGKAGSYVAPSGNNFQLQSLAHSADPTSGPPSAGGRGNLSYVDVDKFGPGSTRVPVKYQEATQGPSGVFSFADKTEASPGNAPGAGGGARPVPSVKVGSRAPGYSPNGVVIVRLVKIVS